MISRIWILGFEIVVCMIIGCIASNALAAQATLAWDPNSEADLEGYGVYFKLGASGPPYDLFGYVTLQELNDPDNPAFAVTDLAKGSSYYFVVTASTLYGDFGALGLWSWNGTAWTQLPKMAISN